MNNPVGLSDNRGFTLVEFVLVVTIIGVLSAAGAIYYGLMKFSGAGERAPQVQGDEA